MHMIDLPVELLKKVLEQTVFTVGLTEAIKLRLVSKMFDEEIPLAMCNARILDVEDRRLIFVPNNSWLIAEHIFRNTWANNYATGRLPTAIRLAARALVAETDEDPETGQENYVRMLCKAAAWHTATKVILRDLKTRTEEDNHSISSNSTIVSAAAYLGDLDFFIRLSREGEIDSCEDCYFGNPLQCAIVQGHYELTRFMLDHGVNVNQAGLHLGCGLTALQTAALTGQEEFIHLILDPKYQCHTFGVNYEYAILKAAAAGHLPIVQLLIDHVNMDPTQELRNRLLMESAQNGHEAVVRFALQIGADPNTEERCHGYQIPITAAAKRGYDKVVKILLESGAIPKVGGRYDTLRGAKRRGYQKTVQVLLDHWLSLTNTASDALASSTVNG